MHHIGKLLLAHCAELFSPSVNHGLPPNQTATGPLHNYYFAKGLDIHTAAYVGELLATSSTLSTPPRGASSPLKCTTKLSSEYQALP